MAIGELLKIVAPPANPVEARNGEAWERAQKIIGTKLPSDFREIGLHYGSGSFCEISIVNPLSADFERAMTYLLETLREVKGSSIYRDYPYEVFPDQPGLLPWGSDQNGNTLHWLTEGEPDDWPVIIESHEGELERFNMSMTTFLAKAFTYEIQPKHVWHAGYQPFADLTFTPALPSKAKKIRKKTRKNK